MAEKMFAQQIRQRGLSEAVRASSAGIGDWNAGKCADERTVRVLRAHGYPSEHHAAQIGGDHLAADLVVAMDSEHALALRGLGVEAGRIRMLRSFDPCASADDLDVDDPYYGDHHDFQEVFDLIAAALPGLHGWVDERIPEE